MPGNLRYGLTRGLSTASKKCRPGSHYLESPFLHSKHAFQTRPELYTRFISSPAWDLIAQHRSGESKLPASTEARAPNSRKVPRAGVEEVFLFCRKRGLGGFLSFGLTSFLGVYHTDITQYITLCPPHNSLQHYDFTGLTPND